MSGETGEVIRRFSKWMENEAVDDGGRRGKSRAFCLALEEVVKWQCSFCPLQFSWLCGFDLHAALVDRRKDSVPASELPCPDASLCSRQYQC